MSSMQSPATSCLELGRISVPTNLKTRKILETLEMNIFKVKFLSTFFEVDCGQMWSIAVEFGFAEIFESVVGT